MSGAPTSGGEPPDAEALARAGWRDEEITWEHTQEAAAEALAAGDWTAAADYWEAALAIARETFGADDPRLAASLANQALARRRAGRAVEAADLFAEALAVWDRSASWIDSLRPERRARSSTYHLRLERKHPGGYDHHARARHRALADEGRAAVLALREGGGEPQGRLARWRRERPDGLTDTRKLLAAVLLIAEAAP